MQVVPAPLMLSNAIQLSLQLFQPPTSVPQVAPNFVMPVQTLLIADQWITAHSVVGVHRDAMPVGIVAIERHQFL